METYILISFLNDFLFCPKSIYFHNLYGQYNSSTYHDTPQVAGKIRHESIDEQRYSGAAHLLQALDVFSDKFGICGKIDVLDTKANMLIERKNKIHHVYDGYVMQLYGQYFCLVEMGYSVRSLRLHSLSDNKRYEVPLPGEEGEKRLQSLIAEIAAFDPSDQTFIQASEKCQGCIYRDLCDSRAM